MRTSLFNSLLMHWSFESKETIEKGVSEIAILDYEGLIKKQKICERDSACLKVEYPFFLDVYMENVVERIEIGNEINLASFLGSIDEDLIVRLAFPLKVGCCYGKVKTIFSKKEFLVVLSNSLKG